jgi:hypothetical protein
MKKAQELRAELRTRIDERAKTRWEIERLIGKERDQSYVISLVLEDLRALGVKLDADAFTPSSREDDGRDPVKHGPGHDIW